MSSRPCTRDGCDSPIFRLQFCYRHYNELPEGARTPVSLTKGRTLPSGWTQDRWRKHYTVVDALLYCRLCDWYGGPYLLRAANGWYYEDTETLNEVAVIHHNMRHQWLGQGGSDDS